MASLTSFLLASKRFGASAVSTLHSARHSVPAASAAIGQLRQTELAVKNTVNASVTSGLGASRRWMSSEPTTGSGTTSSAGASAPSTTAATVSKPASTDSSANTPGTGAPASLAWLEPANLTPSEVVESLSKHIIGQDQAKRAIAIALRNRWRRMKLPQDQQDEIIPKNILMVGPTGCGKTEIARRLAKMCRAPFVKVEATKFTEVGYHGRDVDSIIKDLMDASLQLVKELKTEQFRDEVKPIVEDRIIKALVGPAEGADESVSASFRDLYREGMMEDSRVEVEVPIKEPTAGAGGAAGRMGGMAGGDGMEVSLAGMGGPGATIDMTEILQRMLSGGGSGRKMPTHKKSLTVREARKALEDAELEKKLATLDLRREAVTLAEQNGIVFIDEIDKLVSNRSKHSGDASSEGVQRDLLPLIEGTVIEVRRFGNVKTDYMLFVASGAFHEHKPSELLAELQGRLPIRVELKGLDAKDLERILTETRFNMLEQQRALLSSEGVDVTFEPEAVSEIARLAAEINRSVENIGARRLHTVIEKIMEDISYTATDLVRDAKAKGESTAKVVIDKALVRKKLLPLLERSDFSKFIL